MRVNLELLMPLMAQYKAPAWATIVAGFFVLLALSLSMYLIFDHLSAYNNPEVSAFLSAASVFNLALFDKHLFTLLHLFYLSRNRNLFSVLS
jgi:hypothetical protein